MEFFTLLIIAGIISLFNRLLTGEQKQENQDTVTGNTKYEQQKSAPSRQTHQYQQRNTDIEEQTITLDEQREIQMEQLASRMNTTVTFEDEPHNITNYDTISSPITVKNESNLHKDQIKMKKRIHGKLTRDGLVDSIIMAEVLGQPRALAPYKNILSKK